MTIFSLSGLLIAITCLGLFFSVLIYGRTKLHRIWAFFNLVVSIWGIGVFMVGRATSEGFALFAWRVAFMGALFTCVLFYHTVCIFGNLNRKKVLIFAYLQGIFFAILTVGTNLIFRNWHILFGSLYYSRATIWYYLLILCWTTVTFLAHYELFIFSKNITGFKRVQGFYLFYGSLIGFTGGVCSLLPAFGLYIYPLINFTIPIYAAIETYAIIKYRLMDIRVFLSRAVAFLISYSMLLIIPFFFAYRMYPVLYPLLGLHWWLVPVGLLTFFATVAPFAYDQIRRGMEDALLAEQKKYQKLLLQAASGMVREHNLVRLAKLIVYIVRKVVKIEFAAIFLYDKEQKAYNLRAMRDSGNLPQSVSFLEEHNFVSYLKNKREPVLYEEMPLALKNSFSLPLEMNLIIPSFIEDNLLGFLVLGEKLNREPYSQDDLNVFKILAHQAAMAIENCFFFEEFKNVQEKIFNAEKLASIGGMADGVAHQIKNRLNHFSLGAGEMQNEIKDFIEKHPQAVEQTPDLKKSLDYILHLADSMVGNVHRTDAVVRGILGYARVEEKGTFFSEFSFKEIVDTSLELLKIKHEVAEFPLQCSLGVENIHGVKAQIMESIYNILDNAYEAILDKRNYRLTDEEKLTFTPLIKLKVSENERNWRLEISDNGIGVKEQDAKKIFAPFFTTKSSYKSGTGIGMYVVKTIVEENHHGKIWFESTYMQGTKFVIELPKK